MAIAGWLDALAEDVRMWSNVSVWCLASDSGWQLTHEQTLASFVNPVVVICKDMCQL